MRTAPALRSAAGPASNGAAAPADTVKSRLGRSLTQVLSTRAKPKPEEADEDEDEDDDFEGEPNTHLGENMTAMAIPGRVLAAPRDVIQGPLPTERVAVVLNFGIIDILQEYNLSKQVEQKRL